jgi:hypothetical protein
MKTSEASEASEVSFVTKKIKSRNKERELDLRPLSQSMIGTQSLSPNSCPIRQRERLPGMQSETSRKNVTLEREKFSSFNSKSIRMKDRGKPELPDMSSDQVNFPGRCLLHSFFMCLSVSSSISVIPPCVYDFLQSCLYVCAEP